MSDDRSTHLVERAAARLRNEAGLAEAEAAPPLPAPPPSPAPSPAGTDNAPLTPASADNAETSPPFVSLVRLVDAGLVVRGARNRTTEEYRVCVGRLVRSLRQLRAGAANLVMVTSPRPGEGKSFSVLNMAASIALNGVSEVLLIDCDSKPGSLSTELGLKDLPGLADLAADPAKPVSAAIRATEVPGLFVLPIGRSPQDSDGITKKMLNTIERVAQTYPHHVVLLDTPPCLSTSDSSTIAQIVDLAVMVVQAERTQRSEIEAALEILQHCPHIVMMLNQLRARNSSSFGHYSYSYYGHTA
jgi:receptor protein-tyrosine kinase